MPQIYDMGPPALFPLRRKVCWGFFRPEKSNGFGRVSKPRRSGFDPRDGPHGDSCGQKLRESRLGILRPLLKTSPSGLVLRYSTDGIRQNYINLGRQVVLSIEFCAVPPNVFSVRY
jgi:hypothetical protein